MQSYTQGYADTSSFHKVYVLTLWEQKACLHAKETSGQGRKTQTVTGKQVLEGKLFTKSTKMNSTKGTNPF